MVSYVSFLWTKLFPNMNKNQFTDVVLFVFISDLCQRLYWL